MTNDPLTTRSLGDEGDTEYDMAKVIMTNLNAQKSGVTFNSITIQIHEITFTRGVYFPDYTHTIFESRINASGVYEQSAYKETLDGKAFG
jgi:uncharacterized DUF497 family protein